MRLNRPYIGATLPSLGETEASSAGEQLAEGYPSRAVTDVRRGRPPGLPAPTPLLSAHASKNSRPEGGASAAWQVSSRWPEFPEKGGHIFRNAQAVLFRLYEAFHARSLLKTLL
jgi:hypothetical protein